MKLGGVIKVQMAIFENWEWFMGSSVKVLGEIRVIFLGKIFCLQYFIVRIRDSVVWGKRVQMWEFKI